jgi:carboxymethylenebutenolidase
VIVLPEIFGLNRMVRDVADRFSAAGLPALEIPLFARTAAGLDFYYSDQDLAEGRRHKDATTADHILSEVSVAMAWLPKRCPRAAIQLVGFCFGGRAALIAAMLPGVPATFDFYGVGVRSHASWWGSAHVGAFGAGPGSAHLHLWLRRFVNPSARAQCD